MKEILTTLFRRKRAFFTFLICMITVTMALAYVLPAQYQGKATLMITPGRFKKPFLPDERDDRTSFMQVSMEDVGSEVEILTSQPVLARVVETNGLDQEEIKPDSKKLKKWVKGVLKAFNQTLIAIGLKPELPAKEAAISKLAGDIKVEFVKRTNIIQVKYRASSPELASQVVNSLVDAYLAHHIKVHGHTYVLNAVKAEMERSEILLRAAEDSLKVYSNINSISDIEIQRQGLLQKLGQAEGKIQLLESASTRGLSAEILGSVSEDPSIVGLTQKLTDLEMRRIDLATHYGGEDRKLVALVQEIEEMRQLILKRTQKSLITWKSLAGTYRKQLGALDRHKVVIDRLKQDIEGLQRVYLLNREKTDEILISKAMDNAVLAGARIVESASINPNPVFPKRMPILIISVFLGVVFGVAYAVIIDRLSGKVLSLVDVETAAQAPVLASIPEYSGRLKGKMQVLPTSLMARDLLPVRVGLSSDQNHELSHTLRSILLISPSPEAGTTLVTEQLASLLATHGTTVLLSISDEERHPQSVDWMTACSPDFPPEAYLVKDSQSEFYRLSVASVPNQLGAQGHPMELLLESLRKKGVRYLIADPGSNRGDTQYLKFVPWMTHILLIAAYNRTSKPALARMAEVTRRHGGNLVGCLYNRRENVIPEFLYQRLF